MITGFNTDIKFDGVTYHVQTEDKGLTSPFILSLVYDGGTILASKRSPYVDLLKGEFDDKALSERLQRQHKLICAAVKGGRIEDLKRMSMKGSGQSVRETPPDSIKPARTIDLHPEPTITGFETMKIAKEFLEIPQETLVEPEDLVFSAEVVEEELVLAAFVVEEPMHITAENFVEEPQKLIAFREMPVPLNNKNHISNLDSVETLPSSIPKPIIDLPFEGRQVVTEASILPGNAVAIVSENSKKATVNDGRLWIKLLDESEFVGGERRTLNVSVHRGNSGQGLSKAHVIIKILGSSFRPVIFHAKTDPSGFAIVHLQLPSFSAGRAVLLIRVLFEGEEAEVRFPLVQSGLETV